MFDSETSRLLRSAPGVPGLDAESIPAMLTAHYARLVSSRLVSQEQQNADNELWPPSRIADTYELVASLEVDRELKKAAAFVSATAHLINAKEDSFRSSISCHIDRDSVNPILAAAILFLAAEQYADAAESVANFDVSPDGHMIESAVIAESIVDLANGNLTSIVNRASTWRQQKVHLEDSQEIALAALLETLIIGIEILAAKFTAKQVLHPINYQSARHAFERVLNLSAQIESQVLYTYPGPNHLASLLIALFDGISESGLTAIPPPVGADHMFWERWINFRSIKFPYVWPNHRTAIKQGFHQAGVSAVVVLPTGAGKTTVSSIKIAGVLARKKKVIFLAPTHALSDQLTADLQEAFPKDLLGSVVSSDFDLLFQDATKLRDVEVMTPERCLAMLSFAPEAFSEVGLLVFDECHLLSPQPGRIRRSLDGMLCILAFRHLQPELDYLFLSAMLKNGEEIAEWVGAMIGRTCLSIDLLWKPSRQARGVVIYHDDELADTCRVAEKIQVSADTKSGKLSKGIRVAAQAALQAAPWAIWGLQHNWLQSSKNIAHCTFTPLLSDKVNLTGALNSRRRIYIKPNANKISSRLAATAASRGMKTIVFVNTKNDAVSVAREVTRLHKKEIKYSKEEQDRFSELETELGGLTHSYLTGTGSAVPHNSAMFRLEREIAERLFKRSGGADVIVATPTLAQGLNLPAQFAILAGDKRASSESNGRESLEAHEILNAAARAGRAGHLANGVVLLIPEPVISFSQGKPLSADVITKLQSILPEDDRCVIITDPIQDILDKLTVGAVADPDTRYLINRLATIKRISEGELDRLFNLNYSLSSFQAAKKSNTEEYKSLLGYLNHLAKTAIPEATSDDLIFLASQSGLPISLLQDLQNRIIFHIPELPATIADWLTWTLDWLTDDVEAATLLLADSRRAIMGSVGLKKDGALTSQAIFGLRNGLHGWIAGESVKSIELLLGGDPNSATQSKRVCPRSRELINSVIPRGLSFTMGLISTVALRMELFEDEAPANKLVLECLSSCVRKGYDSPEKLLFSTGVDTSYSRVSVHQLFDMSSEFEGLT
ncbi:DEAD/DEAH box helicase [Pseudomonas viridiflava]|uniref:DEAD/DEAH box helicase n=1 Tax=Pseudomonas viridiflava TaxID=33069 RepID=UPI000F03BFF1|nr:DEAD/DEAH box helicase [Pseudomonas viridiflava]